MDVPTVLGMDPVIVPVISDMITRSMKEYVVHEDTNRRKICVGNEGR